jgi:hypothetical protein
MYGIFPSLANAKSCQLISSDQCKHVHLISFMQNSDQLLVRYYNEVRLYDVCDGSCLNRISVETVFVHGSLDKVIPCSKNGLLQEWDDTWTEVRRYNLGFVVYGACINRLEDSIAVAAGDYIAVVDLATLTSRKIFQEAHHISVSNLVLMAANFLQLSAVP